MYYNVCDAWPMQLQTYGYLPDRIAQLPFSQYHVMPCGDMCVSDLPSADLDSAINETRTRYLSFQILLL